MVSSKTVREDLNLQFRSKFNRGCTKHSCFHYAILKVLHGFKKKRTTKEIDRQFVFYNIQNNEICEILKMFENIIQFSRL